MVNADSLSINEKKKEINVAGIEASLNMEGLEVTDESRMYAKNRQSNKATYSERVKKIRSRFKKRD